MDINGCESCRLKPQARASAGDKAQAQVVWFRTRSKDWSRVEKELTPCRVIINIKKLLVCE
jgi:hypothetical protein